MTDVLYRSYRPDLEVKPGGDGRTIYGIAVPYGAPTRINEQLTEQFVRGAFNHQINAPNRVKFARDHMALGGSLIGAAALLRDDAAGLYGEFRVSRTPLGDETLELVKDNALDQMSIAFRSRQHRRDPGGIVTRIKADVNEVAMVLQGAYGELAAAGGVRSADGSVHADGGELLASEELDLRYNAERYLSGQGLPELRDLDTQLRAIQLGLI